jgi:neprilysin
MIYKKSYVNILKLIFGDIENAEEEIDNLVEFETRLANIMSKLLLFSFIELNLIFFKKIKVSPEKMSTVESAYSRHTLTSLTEKLATFLNWKDFLNKFLSKYESKERITDDDSIIIMGIEYFEKLNAIITEYKSNEKREHTLKLFVVSSVIKFSLPFLSQPFQDEFEKIDEVITGSKKTERWQTCIESTDIIYGLGYAVARLFIRKSGEEAKFVARHMIQSIKDSFKDHFPQVPWMDRATRLLAQEKVDTVEDLIGYPSFITNDNELNKKYQNLVINENDYFGNELRLVHHALKYQVSLYRRKVDRSTWDMTAAAVNAYYSPTRNQIVFPSGILRVPFFHPGNPMAINYGSIGTIMGHELTHGFDDDGRKYDKNGVAKKWWNNQTIDNFKKASECIVKQYSKYSINKESINGNLTLGENIADNGGLRASYNAYMKWIEENGEEKELPILNINNRQLFFITFAQTWCTTATQESVHMSLLTDPHSPPKYRVIGSLSNSIEFANAFNCPIGSKMNPKDKCQVW